MDHFYEDAASLFVQAYDVFNDAELPHIAGDIEFYSELAAQSGGTVLDLACGTGRIALPLAEAGHIVTGVDISDGMLSVAHRKSNRLSNSVRARLTLVHQDMTNLQLDRTFDFAFVAYRSFQHLLEVELQKRALQTIRAHVKPGGRLALHLFDPRLDLLIDEEIEEAGESGTDTVTGCRYVSEVLKTRFDHLAQIRRDLWRYAEIDSEGQTLREQEREMALRWTYRWELHHLMEICGFTVEGEFSDFKRSEPVYGRELIIVGRAV